MMTFHARYDDNRLASVNLGGGDFEQSMRIDRDFLEQADRRFITHDPSAGTVTLHIDEGRAIYRVTGVGGYPRFLDVDLVSVDRGCEVCKREGGRHQWWCTHAT